MSITTHTGTIREYVKNHTKDDIAIFFEHQFVAKDAEIERLKDLCKESLRCMQEAKRKFAPTTTNSDADVHIARLAAYLKEKS